MIIGEEGWIEPKKILVILAHPDDPDFLQEKDFPVLEYLAFNTCFFCLVRSFFPDGVVPAYFSSSSDGHDFHCNLPC